VTYLLPQNARLPSPFGRSYQPAYAKIRPRRHCLEIAEKINK
jgi:hypothetical protein